MSRIDVVAIERPRFALPVAPPARAQEAVTRAVGRLLFPCMDRAAIDQATDLYERHVERVRRYFASVVRDRHEVEDLTQQVFVKAIAALPQYEQRGGAGIEDWLFRIARNCLIDHGRRQRARSEDPFALARRRERTGPSVPPPLATLLASAAFDEIVAYLSPLQQQVLALRYQLDFSNARIAAVLGRSDVSIRQAHHQGLRALQSRVAPVLEPPSRRSVSLSMSRTHARRPTMRFARLRPFPAARS